MRINGEWLECDDGVIRLSIKGMVRLADGQWVEVTFLLDAVPIGQCSVPGFFICLGL